MQSEDFDIRLRQAADQHHPDYDEKAWPKMEKLLDQQLPQGKDNWRRGILVLLMFLFLAGGMAIFINQPWKEKRNTGQVQPTMEKPADVSSNETIADKNETDKNRITREETSTKIKEGKQSDNPHQASVQPVTKPDQSSAELARLSKTPLINPPRANFYDAGKKQESKKLKKYPAVTPGISNASENDQSNKDSPAASQLSLDKLPDNVTADKKINDAVTNLEPPAKVTSSIEDKATQKNDIVPDKVTKITKNQAKKTNSFLLSLSAGPDVSAIGTNELGRLKLLAGIGIGYSFRDKWTIRTGFYTGRKVYSAGPGYYKFPVPPQNPGYLYEIAADCNVYEIPLNLAFNFSQSKNHNLFASVGLSSLIMKKEDYDYQYKYPTGQSWSYQHSISNKNRHYFSVLALSAGYERRISKTFSVMAEPYYKLPLAGIGYGKVKLKSAGLAVSVNIKPFK